MKYLSLLVIHYQIYINQFKVILQYECIKTYFAKCTSSTIQLAFTVMYTQTTFQTCDGVLEPCRSYAE